eukprot:6328088-Amphidinium_carterae.2
MAVSDALSILVGVTQTEEHRDVAGGVAPLAEPVTRFLHKQDAVPIVPSATKCTPQHAQWYGHVEHCYDNQQTTSELSLSGERGNIAVACTVTAVAQGAHESYH